MGPLYFDFQPPFQPRRAWWDQRLDPLRRGGHGAGPVHLRHVHQEALRGEQGAVGRGVAWKAGRARGDRNLYGYIILVYMFTYSVYIYI